MSLLSIPTEILDLVVQFYVNEVGIAKAWCRRDVCKTFKSVIEYEILAKQPGEAFGHVFTGFEKLVLTHSHRMQYLQYRTKQPNCDRPITAQRLMDLCAELDENSKEKESRLQEQSLMTLCNVAATINFNILEFKTSSQRGYEDDAIVSNADRIAAAISVGNNHWLQKLILDHPGDMIEHSTVLGYPLEAAVVGPQMASLKVLLEHLTRIEQWTKESKRKVERAIRGAMTRAKRQRLEVIEVIIKSIKKNHDDIYLDLIEESWDLVTALGDYGLIKLICDHLPPRPQSSVTLSSYHLIRLGFEDIVRALIGKGYLKYLQGFHMVSAIEHGQADMLRLLLQHGYPPDMPWGGPDKSPLFYAIQLRQTTAVKVLLEHGAKTNINVDDVFTMYIIASKDRRDKWTQAEADIRELINAAGATPHNADTKEQDLRWKGSSIPAEWPPLRNRDWRA
ncbi:hypothetical protein BU24DRAFT_403591 [Aaosphaeria arxii CBS 175.79]|uniref:Uncharacterized protein n=1 Tax=Aaosphaeria arxii CBS 175.79 TaxID=1450172 RepID=A0A6A5Y7F1_9PLEO|nr:uncharacterized protein BU24DRAFT_403591 [Aaosphaeria arxii CBS 175.79]KAF2020484.1 hypothetical protein BU24DRAFT_403591 [Aaosphaeria arxii CBS 175.79]